MSSKNRSSPRTVGRSAGASPGEGEPQAASRPIDQILESARALSRSPGAGARPLALASAPLDNVSWVDFTEVRFFLDPLEAPQGSAPPGYSVFTQEERQMLLDLAAAGIDARSYENDFYRPFREAIAAGVRDNILMFLHQSYHDVTIVEDTATGTLTASYVVGGQQKSEIHDIRRIVDLLVTRLPYQVLADLADSYFSIFFLSTSDLWAARMAFMSRVRIHFYEDPTSSGGYPSYQLSLLYGALNQSNVGPQWDERTDALWGRVAASLLAEFGEGEEELGADEEALTFQAPPPPATHPFQTFVAGEVNLGLRLVYRQEWRPLGTQRGEVVRTVPLGPKQTEKISTRVVRRTKVAKTSEDLKSTETTTETSDTRKDTSEIVDEASRSMKWNVNQEVEGGFNCGVWKIGGSTSFGIGGESAQSSRDTSTRLSETMQKMASKVRNESKVTVSTEFESTYEATSATEIQNPNDEIAVTYVYSKLQTQYEVLTRLAEVQDVVMVAEELPSPQDVGFEWVKQHDWIIARVLLDDSYRDALSSISQEVPQPALNSLMEDLLKARDKTIQHLGSFAAATGTVSATDIDFAEEAQRAFRATAREKLERLRRQYALDAKRHRLYQHIRENLLHYCRATWQQEDPQQRLLRYRRSGVRVPLDWHFEPQLGGEMPIDEFVETFGSDSEAGVAGTFRADPQGRFLPLADLVNPAGPIGFFGNYALFSLRPEYAGSSDLWPLLDVFKTPYTAHDDELGLTVVVDPLQKALTAQVAANPPSAQALEACWKDMLDHVPALQEAFLRAQALVASGEDPEAVAKLTAEASLRRFYAEYLFRRQQSRRFLVDTNNLVVDLVPGEGSALEPFKQAHRAIDVQKADGERERIEIENQRRTQLVAEGRLADPDVSRVVVVSDDGDLGAAVLGLARDGEA